MSNNRLLFEGMDELRAQLHALPEDLATEAEEIVIAHAEGAKREIEAAYPIRATNLHPTERRKSTWFPPGNLHSRVTSVTSRSRVTTSAIVKSRAPHAFIFEKGTGNRVTNRGWNRGRMPAAPDAQRMIPKVIRWRRRMVDALKELVLRHGASEVTE